MFGRKKVYDFYVAGPMRGYKQLNKPMFSLVARLLRADGFTVWSPSEHESYLKRSFSQVMKIDLDKVINECRKIALLPNWRESLGANMEMFSAFACGNEAVEVIVNVDKTDIHLIPFDPSNYRLPYQIEDESRKFDPHKCQLDSFVEDEFGG